MIVAYILMSLSRDISDTNPDYRRDRSKRLGRVRAMCHLPAVRQHRCGELFSAKPKVEILASPERPGLDPCLARSSLERQESQLVHDGCRRELRTTGVLPRAPHGESLWRCCGRMGCRVGTRRPDPNDIVLANGAKAHFEIAADDELDRHRDPIAIESGD